MKNLARITHHANKVEDWPRSGDRRRLPVCSHPDCRRRVMAMPVGAPMPAHCYGHATDVETAQYHEAWKPQATPAAAFVAGMRVQSASGRLPHPAGTVRTHFGVVTRVAANGNVYVRWDGCRQEDEMFSHELKLEQACPHPASRRFAWHAYNHETAKLDHLCIVCCDCGAVLKGGETIGAQAPVSEVQA